MNRHFEVNIREKKLIFRNVVLDKSPPPSQNCFKVDIRIYTETCLTFFFESFNDTLCINQLCKHSSVDVEPAYLDIWINTWTLNDVLRFSQKYSLEFKMFKSLTPNIKWILGEVQISAWVCMGKNLIRNSNATICNSM